MANAILIKPLALGTVTAGSSAAGTSPANLDNDFIGVVHRTTATNADWVGVDFGAAVAADFAAFLSMNAGSAQTLRVRSALAADPAAAPDYDSGIGAAIAGATYPTSKRTNSWWDAEAPNVHRRWRFDIGSLLGNPFEAGRLVIGRKIKTGLNYSFGSSRGVKDMGAMDWTKDGVPLIRRGRILRTLNLSYSSLYPDEVETMVLPLLEELGNTRWVLAVTDPSPNDNRQSRMYFGPLIGDLTATHRTAKGFEARVQLVSVI